MIQPSPMPQTLPLWALIQKPGSLGTTWDMARAKPVLELQQFVLFFPIDRILFGIVRLTQCMFSPLGLGDIAINRLSAVTTSQILADVANGLAFAAAIRIGKKCDLVEPHTWRAGRYVHQDTFRVTPNGVPLHLDHHFRPYPQSPPQYLFAAVDAHLHFNSAEALVDFCTDHGLVDGVARLDTGEHLVAEPPYLSITDVGYSYRSS